MNTQKQFSQSHANLKQDILASAGLVAACCVIALGCVFLPSTVQAASYITNGSFESPALGGSGAQGSFTLEGWGGGLYLVRGDVGWGKPQDGNQFVDIGYGAGPTPLSTMFTVPETGTYTLSWYSATGEGVPAGVKYDFYVNVAGGSLIGSGTKSSLDVGASGVWTRQEYLVVLQAGTSYTLTFDASAYTPSFDTLIDNVALVPEPASLMLLGLGVIGLFLRRFARR